jgi:molybdenum cofactor cytidylyltransferase
VIRAIVLAAGASSRMRRPKAGIVLPGTKTTFLERIVQSLLDAGLPDVVVVTGANPEAARRSWSGPDDRVRFVHNARWEEGQLGSLQCGLAAIDSPGLDAALVSLVDVPLVLPSTIARLVGAWRETRAPIVRPSRMGAHGHPVIFDRAVFGELRAASPLEGAKPVIRAHLERIVHVEVDDPGAFRDFDTPDDLSVIEP